MQIGHKLRALLLVFLSFTLISCASPAHENTGYFSDDLATIFVTVHSVDNYEVDGYFVDSKALATLVKSMTSSHSLKSMLIDTSGSASLFDQAVAVYIGEMNNLDVSRKTFFGSELITTKELMDERDEDNEDGFSLSDLRDTVNNDT
jgi:hypothetical protein